MVFALASCGKSQPSSSAAGSTDSVVSTDSAVSADAANSITIPEESSEVIFPGMTLLYDTTCTEVSTSGQGTLLTVAYIENATNGAVTVDKHDNYSLYAQDQIIPAVMSGELAMSATTAAYMADYMPKLTVLASAYLFSSFDHWKSYYHSQDWLDLTDEIAAETNIRVIGVRNKGDRTINLVTDKKILSRADMGGISLRMPNSDSWLFLGEVLGGNPIPVVGGDIYMALQTGMVNVQDNPVGNTMDMGLYEVTRSVTLTNHMYLEDWFIINEDVWKSMTPQAQQVMRAAVAAGYDYVTDTCWSSLEVFLPGLIFVFLFLSYVVLIFCRYVFQSSVDWLYELNSLAFVWCGVFAASYGSRTQSHVRFTVLYERVSPQWRLLFRLVGNFFVVVLFVIAFPEAVGTLSFMKVRKSSILKLPFSWVFSPFLVFLILTILHHVILVINDILLLKKNRKRGEEA